jgi:hypothetical protein
MNRVRVYRNLTRKCLSVQLRQPGKGWRVAYHCNAIDLFNVVFTVHQAGRERVLREKRKNVHAYVTGIPHGFAASPSGVSVRYDPYAMGTFHRADTLEPIDTAMCATVSTNGIRAELFPVT